MGHRGTNEVLFDGVLSRSRLLPAGRYAVIIVAADKRIRSRPQQLSCTIEKAGGR
jgi:hypothetical protein